MPSIINLNVKAQTIDLKSLTDSDLCWQASIFREMKLCLKPKNRSSGKLGPWI